MSICTFLCLAFALSTPLSAAGQVFTGNGMGIEDAGNIETGGSGDLRSTAENILFTVISYMGLAAVFVIVIAGIYLIVGGGTDDARSKTVKIILYTIVGLLVILLASAFVEFVITIAGG